MTPADTLREAVEALEIGRDAANVLLLSAQEIYANYPHRWASERDDVAKIDSALSLLRSALEGGEPEPIAWLRKDGMKAMPADEKDAWREAGQPEIAEDYTIPLYASIPPITPVEAGKVGVADVWQPMETAPKDGTEILTWREDCDVLLVKWTSWNEFATDRERDEADEISLFQEDWFYADFRSGGRLEGNEVPTCWQPLPKAPYDCVLCHDTGWWTRPGQSLPEPCCEKPAHSPESK